MLAALSYGELSGMFPKAGGQYVYLKEAYNPLTGFLYGWSFFSVIQSGMIAAVAVAFAKFTSYFWLGASEENILISIGALKISGAQLLAIASIILLTAINAKGVRVGKRIQTTFTLSKLLCIAALITFGFAMMNPDVWSANWTNAWSLQKMNIDGSIASYTMIASFGAIASAMVGGIFSSDAWNGVTFMAGEIVNPKRNIGLSLFLGTLTVCSLYVITHVMYTAVLPMQEIAGAPKDRVAIVAAHETFGALGTAVIAMMVMVSTFGCNNGLILAGARVYYTMANDGFFFKKAGSLNKHAVPEFALWIQCIVCCILCISGRYGDLLDMISFVVVLFYMLTIAGIFILRKKAPDAERPYKAFGYPVLPALYILMGISFCTLLIIYKPNFTWGGLIIVLLGLPIYYVMNYKKRKV